MNLLSRLGIYCALMTGLVLTGCGNAEQSGQSTPASQQTGASTEVPSSSAASAEPSASPSASNDSNLVPLIDQMTEPTQPEPSQDDAGAMEFVVYYFDASDWAYATRDDSELARLCVAGNEQCARLREGVAYLANNDLVQYGGRTTFTVDGLIIANPEPDIKQVQTRILIDPAEIRDQTGQLIDSRDSYDMVINTTIKWVDGGWIVLSGVRVES